jgi:hypothetical protein
MPLRSLPFAFQFLGRWGIYFPFSFGFSLTRRSSRKARSWENCF